MHSYSKGFVVKIISKGFISILRHRKKNPYLTATTFLPNIVIFWDEKNANDPMLCNHEAIHAAQLWEGWIVGHWFQTWWFGRKYNYMGNPFEREAYANQKNLDYLKTRKHNAWKEYIIKDEHDEN